MEAISPDLNPDKLKVLINYLDPVVYDFVSECTTYDAAIKLLNSIYVKKKNEIFARHLLATRKQKPGESIDQFLQSLKPLSTDCNFKQVSAVVYSKESIRDAIINGLQSNYIRQRLLENETLDLQQAFDHARALDLPKQNSAMYDQPSNPVSAATSYVEEITESSSSNKHIASVVKSNCWFCGNWKHARSKCPAREVICHKCGKKGHFAKLCQSINTQSPT